MRRHEVDLVLLDLSMPGMNGVETFREIHSLRPALPVMIVTWYPNSDLMAQALEIGSFTMISKPVDLAQIQKTVDRIVASHRAALGPSSPRWPSPRRSASRHDPHETRTSVNTGMNWFVGVGRLDVGAGLSSAGRPERSQWCHARWPMAARRLPVPGHRHPATDGPHGLRR